VLGASSTRAGRLRRPARSSRLRGRSSSDRAAASSMPRTTLDGMAGAGCRPRRRRLPPLLGTADLARPALRERCSTTTRCSFGVPARLGRERASRLSPVVAQTGEYMLRECSCPRAPSPRADADTNGVEGLTFTVDRDEGVPRAAPAVRARPLDHSRRAQTRSCACGSSSSRAASEASRDDKGSHRGTAWTLGGSRERAAASSAMRLARRGPRARGVSARPLSDGGRLRRSYVRAGHRHRHLEDYATSRTGFNELHVATGELAGSRSRAAWPGCSGALRRRGAAAASSSRRPMASGSWARKKDFDDHPSPSGTRCSRSCSCGWRESTARTSSSACGRRPQLVHGRSRVPLGFGHTLCGARPPTSRRHARSRSSARRTRRLRERRSSRSTRTPLLPSGLRRHSLSEGRGSSKQACGLRLQRFNLPPPVTEPAGASGSRLAVPRRSTYMSSARQVPALRTVSLISRSCRPSARACSGLKRISGTAAG